MAVSMRTQIDQARAEAYAQGLEAGGRMTLEKIAEAVDAVLAHGGTAEQRTTLRAVKTTCLLVADGMANDVSDS